MGPLIALNGFSQLSGLVELRDLFNRFRSSPVTADDRHKYSESLKDMIHFLTEDQILEEEMRPPYMLQDFERKMITEDASPRRQYLSSPKQQSKHT